MILHEESFRCPTLARGCERVNIAQDIRSVGFCIGWKRLAWTIEDSLCLNWRTRNKAATNVHKTRSHVLGQSVLRRRIMRERTVISDILAEGVQGRIPIATEQNRLYEGPVRGLVPFAF